MEPTQVFLHHIYELGTPLHTTNDEGWFAVVVNDPDELDHTRSAFGLQVKLRRLGDGNLEVIDTGVYNR
jgi:hypothetical protein